MPVLNTKVPPEAALSLTLQLGVNTQNVLYTDLKTEKQELDGLAKSLQHCDFHSKLSGVEITCCKRHD